MASEAARMDCRGSQWSEGSLRPAGAKLRCLAFILSAAAAIRRSPTGADMIRATFEVAILWNSARHTGIQETPGRTPLNALCQWFPFPLIISFLFARLV